MVCNEAPWALTVIAMAALRPRSAWPVPAPARRRNRCALLSVP